MKTYDKITVAVCVVLGLLCFAAILRGADEPSNNITISPYHTLEVAITSAQGRTIACWIDDKDRFYAAPGKQEFCWEQIVQAHNEGMNGTNHPLLDRILLIAADGLGKKIVPCAKTVDIKWRIK